MQLYGVLFTLADSVYIGRQMFSQVSRNIASYVYLKAARVRTSSLCTAPPVTAYLN